MRGPALLLLLLSLVWPAAVPGCASTLAPVPADLRTAGDAGERAESLRASVEAVVEGGGNLGRFRAVRDRAAGLGLEAYSRTEWIDWFTLQKNLVVEIPGKTDRLVYIVAHYDKTDTNPFRVVSLLLNGLLEWPRSTSTWWASRSAGTASPAGSLTPKIDIRRLWEQFAIIRGFLEAVDAEGLEQDPGPRVSS